MKILIPILLVFSVVSGTCQTSHQNDSIVSKICEYVEGSPQLLDSVRIEWAFQEHLDPYLTQFDEKSQKSAYQNIYFRLLRNCPIFWRLMDGMYPNENEWQEFEGAESELSSKKCKKFLKIGAFWYTEGNGDRTYVAVDSDYWIDTFKDGTTSKLSMDWKDNCVFEIEFIESNNWVRSNTSRKGDRYRYTILSRQKGFYEVQLEIPETGQKFKFRMNIVK